MYTLHEAIEMIIKKNGKPMTAVEIARVLNTTMPLYKRGDGMDILSSQIGARVKNYPQWFTKDGNLIGLLHNTLKATPKKVSTFTGAEKLNFKTMAVEDVSLASKILMNEKNFRSVSGIDIHVTPQPGLYAIRINNPMALPKPFADELMMRQHNLLYIGIASKSLQHRMLGQELRAKGHGTFFRSLGALLGFVPPKGSLAGKANSRNYSFGSNEKEKIVRWINEHLTVNWVPMSEGWEDVETNLILQHKPLLNIAKNPIAMRELIESRKKCVIYANECD